MAEPTNAYRIKTDPDPMEAYRIAQGYRVGNLIYLSGIAAITKHGEVVGEGDFEAQGHQVFANMQDVLAAAGSDLSKVIKVTIFVTDISQFETVVALRERYFAPPYPADTIVEVKALALPQLMIEIEAVALATGEIIDT